MTRSTGDTAWGVALFVCMILVPSRALASDMSGIIVIVAGMFVGIPAALLLVLAIVLCLVFGRNPAPWHRTLGAAVLGLSPFLVAAYPVSVVMSDGRAKFLGVSLMFNLPTALLGASAMFLGYRLRRRAMLVEREA